MEASEALNIARDRSPMPPQGVYRDDPIGITAGTEVCVSPSDYAEARIVGELIGTTVSSVSIRREDPRVGEVSVYFLKIGYTVKPTNA